MKYTLAQIEQIAERQNEWEFTGVYPAQNDMMSLIEDLQGIVHEYHGLRQLLDSQVKAIETNDMQSLISIGFKLNEWMAEIYCK